MDAGHALQQSCADPSPGNAFAAGCVSFCLMLYGRIRQLSVISLIMQAIRQKEEAGLSVVPGIVNIELLSPPRVIRSERSSALAMIPCRVVADLLNGKGTANSEGCHVVATINSWQASVS